MKKRFFLPFIFIMLFATAFTLAACDGSGDAGAPSAPQDFTATAGNGQMILTWTALSDKGDSEIIKYEVSKDNGNTWITASSDTSHTFTGLTNGKLYTFKVRAVNSNGNGIATTVSAKPVDDPDNPLSGASFKLPVNVSIKYENMVNDSVVTISLFVKIGNNFYCDTRSPSGEIVAAVYLISNGGSWTRWEKSIYSEWGYDLNLNAADVINESAGSGVNRMLGFMSYEARYAAIKDVPVSGIVEVAGVICDEYVIGGRVLRHDPVSNLFLQDKNPPAHYRVLLWNTSITGFEDADALKLDPQI